MQMCPQCHAHLHIHASLLPQHCCWFDEQLAPWTPLSRFNQGQTTDGPATSQLNETGYVSSPPTPSLACYMCSHSHCHARLKRVLSSTPDPPSPSPLRCPSPPSTPAMSAAPSRPLPAQYCRANASHLAASPAAGQGVAHVEGAWEGRASKVDGGVWTVWEPRRFSHAARPLTASRHRRHPPNPQQLPALIPEDPQHPSTHLGWAAPTAAARSATPARRPRTHARPRPPPPRAPPARPAAAAAGPGPAGAVWRPRETGPPQK